MKFTFTISLKELVLLVALGFMASLGWLQHKALAEAIATQQQEIEVLNAHCNQLLMMLQQR